MTSVYSFGEESPIKFRISDRMAQLFNEAAAEFFKAQTRFNQKFGRKWNPTTDPIEIRWNRPQRKAWNDFAKLFEKTVEELGPFHPNDFMDDFLVRNASGVVVAGGTWGRVLTLAAAGGALYGFFNRRER